MPLDTIQVGGTSGNKAEVDSSGNAKVVFPNTPAQVGSVRNFSENDPGTVTGTPYLKSPEVSNDYRLRVGMDTLLFGGTFSATSQNTSLWKYAFTTMTMTQSAGFLNINAAGTSTVSGNYALLQSWQHFPLYGTASLYIEFTGQITNTPTANEVFVAGVGIPSAATEPADGVYWRLTSAGLYGVLKYNGTETVSGLLRSIENMATNTNSKYVMSIAEREIEWWIDDVLMGETEVPNANGQPFITTALPIFFMKYNSNTIGSSPNMIVKVGDVTASVADFNTTKPWAHQMAGMGMSAYQGQNGGTMGQTTTFANSTNPTTALPVNASLTANLPSGLGGLGLATLWNLASTDMLMMSYQNPAGGVNQTPRNLYITGVRISPVSYTAAWTAPASGVHSLLWGIAFGHTAASLATTDTSSFANNTTKSPRRKSLGITTWSTGTTAIGTSPDRGDIYVQYISPLVVNPGQYVAIICRMLNGAATATGGLYYAIDFDGYFE